MKKIQLILITLIGISSFAYSQLNPPKTTVYIVRHAEKDLTDPKNPDPELSSLGQERSIALAFKLRKEKFAAIFSTNYKRTTKTGSLIAQKGKVEIEFYNPADAEKLADLIKTKYKGQKVLIIGHSNTVLELVESFGVTRPLMALTDDDYDFLFKITVDQTGYASVRTENYGKPHHTTMIK